MRTIAVLLTAAAIGSANAQQDIPSEEQLLSGMEEAVYIAMFNVGDITVIDDAGTRTSTASPQWPPPEFTINRSGSGSWSLVLTIGRQYRLEFKPGTATFEIDAVIGRTNVRPRLATRYRDILLPSGQRAQFEITAAGKFTLRCDADGNGSFEKVVAPTVVVPPEFVSDIDPPTVHVAGRDVVTLTAEDNLAGVAMLCYSLDFKLPVCAKASRVRVNVRGAKEMIVYADDRAGNRSSAITYTVPK